MPSVADPGRHSDLHSNDYIELAKARVREVVPEADLTALAVVFTLIRTADRIAQDLETVHRPVGWTWAGFRILFWVWLLGPLEQREIASLTSSSAASVSSALNTLERDGFVRRQRDPGDRRRVRVELTTAGGSLVAEAFRSHNARERAWTAVLTEAERATLVELLSRMLDHGSRASTRPARRA
jgi:DNA-binding MarR family transcriptional regulator